MVWIKFLIDTLGYNISRVTCIGGGEVKAKDGGEGKGEGTL